MKVVIITLTILTLISCQNKSNNQRKPQTEANSYFLYTNSMMDSTLEKRETYLVEKKSDYNINDVVVFNYYDLYEKRQIRVAYRVIGKPGDTVQIKNSQVFINGKLFILPFTTLFHYSAVFKKMNEKIKVDFNIQGLSGNKYDCFLTEHAEFFLAKKYSADIVSIRKCPLDMNQKVLLNFQNDLGWDMDNFGPVFVPKLNSIINSDTAKLFINKYYGSQETGVIKISEPLYFVIGDNFDNASSDSRSIGLINYAQIEGSLKL